MHSLTLFIPGLFPARDDLAVVEPPPVPSMQKILSRSRRELLAPFTFGDALAMLFHIEKIAGRDYPLASITRLVDDEEATGGIWMRADPVHLFPDQAGLLLMDDSMFNLDQHDALVLAADIRQLFTEYGMDLEAPTTTRWYVRLDKLPAVTTMPIHEVTGCDINHCMPKGEDSAFWIRLLNEVQMVLHDCDINRRRESDGEKPVNSTWFWGAGELPAAPTGCVWNRMYTDEPVSSGMARLAGIEYAELPDNMESVASKSDDEEDILVVISFGMRHRQYRDINGWQDFLDYLEEFWFADMETLIRSGDIGQLTVLTEYQRFDLGKPDLYKFWRRVRPVTIYGH